MLNPFLIKRLLTLTLLCYFFYFFGNEILPLTDPDETFYTLSTKEMMAHDSWLVPHIFDKPQFEKPILTYWLLRIIFEIGGITPFNVRFFPALFGLIGVLGIYALGRIGFRDEKKAFWSAVILATGGLYVGLSKTIFTDLFFSVFIMFALLCFYMAYTDSRRLASGIIGFYLFGALATLTKGPLGLLIPELAVVLFLLYRGQIGFLRNKWVLPGFILATAVALPWYIYMYKNYGYEFIHEFFYNDHWRRVIEAEHKGNDRWYFYPMTMVVGFFPWAIFVAGAFVDFFKRLKNGVSAFEYFLLSWILIVFLVFQFAHSKLTSYIVPMFPAIALLTGNYVCELYKGNREIILRRILFVNAGALAILGLGLIPAYPLYSKYVTSLMPVYFLSGGLVALAGLIVAFALQQKYAWSKGVLSMTFIVFLWSAFMMKGDLIAFASSYDAAQYVPHYPGVKTMLLTSKPNARGMRYHTGQDITVVDINGGNFFSPHPVPLLTTIDQLKEFLNKNKRTFASVKKGGYKAIIALPPEEFKVTYLRKSGEFHVMLVEALKGT